MSYSTHNKMCQAVLIADIVGFLILIPLAIMVGFWFHAVACAVMAVVCVAGVIAIRKDKRCP